MTGCPWTHAQAKNHQVEWILIAFLAASLLHMGEEYFYPGGFMDIMKRLNLRFAPLITVPMAVIINSLQLLPPWTVQSVSRRLPPWTAREGEKRRKSQLIFIAKLVPKVYI